MSFRTPKTVTEIKTEGSEKCIDFGAIHSVRDEPFLNRYGYVLRHFLFGNRALLYFYDFSPHSHFIFMFFFSSINYFPLITTQKGCRLVVPIREITHYLRRNPLKGVKFFFFLISYLVIKVPNPNSKNY